MFKEPKWAAYMNPHFKTLSRTHGNTLLNLFTLQPHCLYFRHLHFCSHLYVSWNMWCYFTKQRSTSQLAVSGYSRYLSQRVSAHSSRATHEFTQVVCNLMSKMPPGNVHHSISSFPLLAETFNSLLLDLRDSNKSLQRERRPWKRSTMGFCVCVYACVNLEKLSAGI